MADEVDYYAVLELPPDADDETIRLAYRRLARRYHPDIAGEESLQRMQTLNQAYQTLSDPERRRLYDASRPQPAAPAAPPPPASPAPATETPRSAQRQPSPTHDVRRDGILSASRGPLRRIAMLHDGETSAIVSVALAAGGAIAATGHIDGRITLWQVAEDRLTRRLALGATGRAGTLSEVRISADGAFAMAWGFALGLGVWHLADGALRWASGMNAPSGLMDGVFLPHPAGLLRLALPDAPPTLAESDPFRWADTGRRGTAVYTRPLPASGPINPAWATPLRIQESSARQQLRTGEAPWQIRERALSSDGRRLLTFSTGRPDGKLRSQVLRLWDLDARSARGIVEPRRIAEIAEPDGRLTFPLATTPNLAVVALADFLGHVQIRSLDGRLRQSVKTGPLPLDAFAALTPDAALLAIADEQRLDLWETRTGQRMQQWRLASPLTALTFAPTASNGHHLLAIGLPNGLTELWG